MGPSATQGDEKPKQNCHPDRSEAKWRDLLFYSAVSEMFFDRAQRSCCFAISDAGSVVLARN
jgi:hypothetical protein